MTEAFALSALDAASLRIQAAVGTTADRLVDALGASAAPSDASRHAMAALQTDLRLRLAVFKLEFASAMRERMHIELGPRNALRRSLADTSWEALSLVADEEVNERVAIERLGMEMAHDCEWELRELDSFVGELLRAGQPDPERNPLRPEVIARALLVAFRSVTPQPDLRDLLARRFGPALAPMLRACYVAIVADLRERGVQASGLAIRGVQGPGNDLPREWLRESSGYQTSGSGAAQHLQPGGGGFPAIDSGGGFVGSGSGGLGGSRAGGGHAGGPGAGRGPSAGGGASGGAMGGSGGPGGGPGGPGSRAAAAAADAQMLDILRRIAFMSGGPAADSGFAPDGPAGARSTGRPPLGGAAPTGGSASTNLGAIGDMVAVNLIRQHREELVRASGGALDHMVIDVVGAMFDHLLSDSKVPPQLARQIARLQMPVLRAALKDMGFFSSRRHPVRRFVNRVASLAAAYEDLEEGPGREFIDRVRSLVQEIVEGDFDQMDLYESKLQAIEALIQQQSQRDVGSHATAAALLDGKETQLRIQQRYMMALRGQLEPLALPDYLRDFLSQVWSQVQVQAAGPGGSPEQALRMQQTARDLVLSIQPKGEPKLRKAFLMQLPQLMKDLNEGLERIRWPEPAKQGFFAKLLPAHAESLKTAPPTDFEQRQLKHKLEQMAKVAIPTEKDLNPHAPTPIPPPEEHAAPLQFSDDEAERIGLVEEKAVDWDGVVDIDLGEAGADNTGSAESAAVDIELEAQQQADGAPPTHGPQLIHHLQTGIAYRMHLEGRWQRVRLNWASPGRAFFVFTHGKSHEKTVSMTARMLTRLCETERFRSYEQAELIERATARARKQLAQLGAANSRHGALRSQH